MSEFYLSQKVRDTLVLIYGLIVYIVAVYAVLIIFYQTCGKVVDIITTLAVSFLPLLGVIVIVWGYGLKFKAAGIDIEYYPVEKIAKKPLTIMENTSIEQAERIAKETGNDFMNVVDRTGTFLGLLTKTDLFKSIQSGTIDEVVKNIMTKRENVVFGSAKEDLKSIMKKIGDHKHSRLPVLDENNRLIGVVDSVDINDLLAKLIK